MKTLKYAARHLARAKAYTLINIIGLALSLGCFILLARYLHREYTVDTNCVDRGRVVIPMQDMDGNVLPSILNPDWLLVDTLYLTDSQLQGRCRLILLQDDQVRQGESIRQTHVLVADSTFFRFFRYPVRVGEAALHTPTDAVLTEACARRFFGRANPVGQTLEYAGKTLTVRGVIGEPDCKTTLHFDLVVSYDLSEHWNRMPWELLHVLPSVDLDAINRQAGVYRPVRNANDRVRLTGQQIRHQYLTLQEFYFDQTYFDEETRLMRSQGNLRYLHLLTGVAALLLLVGMLNFVNLYMVLMMKRSKEYGIKKVFGLHRLPLFLQIYAENFLLCAAALLLAGTVAEVGQPLLDRLAGDTIGYTAFDAWLFIGFLLLFPLLTSLYPYLRYNYRPPMVSIRTIGTSRQSIAVRMGFLFGPAAGAVRLLRPSVAHVAGHAAGLPHGGHRPRQPQSPQPQFLYGRRRGKAGGDRPCARIGPPHQVLPLRGQSTENKQGRRAGKRLPFHLAERPGREGRHEYDLRPQGVLRLLRHPRARWQPGGGRLPDGAQPPGDGDVRLPEP